MKISEIIKYNRHFDKGYKYPYPKRRDIFGQIVKNLNTKQIIEITGLRRVGKTTLLMQLINYLKYEKEINPFNIWYFTFDEQQIGLDDLFNEFQKATNIKIGDQKVYVFLDEIQKLPNFQNKIKVYYDLYPELKFIISGSTSLFIRKKTQESLAGRIISHFVPPLNFKEFIYFLGKDEILNNPYLFYKDIEYYFHLYLSSQFIETIYIEDKRFYLESIIRKIIFEDIPILFRIDYPEVLYRLIKIIGAKPGMLVEYQNLANDLKISSKTLAEYFWYLEEAFLIRRLYNFSRNLLTSQKKAKKVYLASSSFSWFFNDSDISRLAENVFVSVNTDIEFFWRDAYKHEVDFIRVKDNNKIIPIEIKFKGNIDNRDLRNLILFSNKFGPEEGIILSKSQESKRLRVKEIEIIQKSIYEMI